MEDNRISVNHLNIRQSITILLVKLITIDLLLASSIIAAYWGLTLIENQLNIAFARTFIFLILFGLTGIIKIVLTWFTVFLWLNEYYEITTQYIYHKKGIFFKKIREYKIDMIRRLELNESLLGELFNFATISIYDIRLNKLLDLYLIHNPLRYISVLKQLKPDVEVEKQHTILPFIIKEKAEPLLQDEEI